MTNKIIYLKKKRDQAIKDLDKLIKDNWIKNRSKILELNSNKNNVK